MKTEIIPVGTEILLGNIVDTDSSFLAGELASLGIDLYFISTVGDNRERLVDTLRRAWKRADMIILTGGLGPTQDDMTREAIADFLGEQLQMDVGLWNELQEWFKRLPGRIPQSNERQAALIPSARVIPNSMGTAPGWWVEKDNRVIIALPGPPEEMKAMWREGVLPMLQQRASGQIILSRTVKTFRLAEARVEELVAPLAALTNPTLATYIKPDGVHLRITAKGREQEEAEHLISHSEARVREVLSQYIWGVDDDTLCAVIARLLAARHLSLATMESCTDGLLCNTIAADGGGHSFFKGGVVACCSEAKTAYGVDASILERYGHEGTQVAVAMAEAARYALKADIGMGLGVTMDLGTNSGEAFTGLKSDRLERPSTHRLRGDRSRMRERAVYTALFDLRQALLEEVQCT